MKFFQGTRQESIIEFDNIGQLKRFIIQTAANVLVACEQYPTGIHEIPTEGIGKIINDYLGWNSPVRINALTNTLMAQVEFLFAIVENAIVSNGLPYNLVDEEKEEAQIRKIIADALTAFQKWKTEINRNEKKEFGKKWGDATEFVQMDWTKYNKDFLALKGPETKTILL
jgi:hypothetical protein